jgi:hypothetical protein
VLLFDEAGITKPHVGAGGGGPLQAGFGYFIATTKIPSSATQGSQVLQQIFATGQ